MGARNRRMVVNMNYKLVYESSYDINYIYLVVGSILLLSAIYFFKKIDNKLFRISAFFIIFFIALSLYSEYNNKIKIDEIMKLTTYKVIEGKVENLKTMPLSGHKPESFKVKDIYFEILYTGDYPKDKTIYYTLTKNRNGPIQFNGQEVKIYYVTINGENKIIKMWIKK
jgi:hypothetical protein